jgi:hypothetical protein
VKGLNRPTLVWSLNRPQSSISATRCQPIARTRRLAAIYAGLGQKDEAFQWLEKAFAKHSSGMPSLATDWFWYEMRSDPRCADLLRRPAAPGGSASGEVT